VVSEGFTFTEGPLWREGKLLVCDLSKGVVSTLTPREDDPSTTELETWTRETFREPSDRAAGSALDPQGRLLLAHFAGKVTRTETDGTITTLADSCATGEAKVPLARCNDLAVRRDGVIFFTDFGKKGSDSKGLFRITPREGGETTVESLDKDFNAANGVALSHDEKTLYVADYGKNVILAYDVSAGGAVSNRRVFADLSKEEGQGRTDGLKSAPDGRVFTTGPGGVWVLSPTGETLEQLEVEGGASNLCLGGEDGRTMFITSGPRVLSVRLVPTSALRNPVPVPAMEAPKK
jgi:gluconolactonase